MEWCCLYLRGGLENQAFGPGREEGWRVSLQRLYCCIPSFAQGHFSQCLKSKSVFQEFKYSISQMGHPTFVKAGLQLFPASVGRKKKSVSADGSWLQLLLNSWSFLGSWTCLWKFLACVIFFSLEFSNHFPLLHVGIEWREGMGKRVGKDC